MRVADYVMQRLAEESCKDVFLVTGRGMLHLSDALARNTLLNSVPVHHEQSASYAAMAYAQVKNELGVCMVSTGCAATNAITGVLCAWQDNIPCIVISGQHMLYETTHYTKLPIRTYGQQEADIVNLVSPITKYVAMITDAQSIAYEMDKALYLAKSGRKGPVWIDIPLCIQNMRVEPGNLKRFTPDTIPLNYLNLDDITEIVELFKESKRPLVLIGSGVRSSNAVELLNNFLEKNNIPAAYANSATDVIDPEKALSMGCVGAMGANRAANFAIQNADLVLLLGCRLTSMVRGDHANKFARGAKIVAVDIDPFEHQKHSEIIFKFILSDIKMFLNELIKTDISISSSNEWIEKCIHWKTIFPKCETQYKQDKKIDLYHLGETLSELLADESVCVTDSGLAELILPTTIEFKKNQHCIHPVSQGAMGYALPAAIGAYYAKEQQTVVIVGDGSIMMNLQELQTIDYNKLPIKVLVINNDGYAVIRKRQQDLFRTRTIGTDQGNGLSCANFKKVADCFNMQYELIETTDDLSSTLKKVLNSKESVLCEIMGKENQDYIHSSYRKGLNGRFVQPPIEDQSPFLDRDLFLNEMIIEPIDQ
jgi:acetolactate synthase-1/2/3 large subunit